MTFGYSEYLLWLRIYVVWERKCQTLKGNKTSVNPLLLSSQGRDFTQLVWGLLLLDAGSKESKHEEKMFPKVREASLPSSALHKHWLSIFP